MNASSDCASPPLLVKPDDLAGKTDDRDMTSLGGNMRHLDLIKGEIRKAKQDLVVARDRLLAQRADTDRQIATLDQELALLDQMETGQSGLAARPARANGEPLSRRVIDVLQQNNMQMTFREMRERLQLDRRESRNLGPVLNQLAKMGKISSEGRGAPWRLV